MVSDEEIAATCRHCGNHVSNAYQTEYGTFCNERHADVWETQNTGLFRRIRNAWRQTHG